MRRLFANELCVKMLKSDEDTYGLRKGEAFRYTLQRGEKFRTNSAERVPTNLKQLCGLVSSTIVHRRKSISRNLLENSAPYFRRSILSNIYPDYAWVAIDSCTEDFLITDNPRGFYIISGEFLN